MRLWRISAFPGLTGVGGLHCNGRWHTIGKPVLYASEHPALAMIETIAHMRLSLTNIPINLKLIALEIRDGASMSRTPRLPDGWQANEPTSRAVGNAWLASGSSLLLPVPSALLSNATNYLVNPAHPQAATHVRQGRIEPFWFDKRFMG